MYRKFDDIAFFSYFLIGLLSFSKLSTGFDKKLVERRSHNIDEINRYYAIKLSIPPVDYAVKLQKTTEKPINIKNLLENGMLTRTILIAETADALLHNSVEELSLQFEASFFCCDQPIQLSNKVGSSAPDIVIVDLELLTINSDKEERGFQLIKELQEEFSDIIILPVIPDKKPHLIKPLLALDIYYTLYNPLNPAEISATLNRIAESLPEKTTAQNISQKESAPLPRCSSQDFHGMIGNSQIMQQLFETIEKVAADDFSTVLIRGESGTGKEMVARAIHKQSERAGNNFVPVNCAAIPDDLLESELFGYTRGAFTGANTNKPGRIQYAHKGTLFLDEIGDMKHSLQAKLLRVIQEREFEPVGAFKSVPVNTRILAATHCDLEKLVKEGTFREDLYYRLTVIPLHIPPLRKRPEDIPHLIAKFLEKHAGKRGREPVSFSYEAMAAMLCYPWRGNVRELENLVQQLIILSSGMMIERANLPDKFADVVVPDDFSFDLGEMTILANEKRRDTKDIHKEVGGSEQFQKVLPEIVDLEIGIDFKELINDFETQLIITAMRKSCGNKKEAARLLNLKRTTLLEKIKKKDIDAELWQ